MASPKTSRYGGVPTGWTVTKGKFGVLNGERYGYVRGKNGFNGSQLLFSTNKKVVGSQVEQTIPNFRLARYTDYMISVGVGERFFHKRFAGFTLQLRMADGSLLTQREFGYDEVKGKFTIPGKAHEVAEIKFHFTPQRVDSSQPVKLVLIGGGGAKGGANGRESLDINYIKFFASKPQEVATPPQLLEFRGIGLGLSAINE